MTDRRLARAGASDERGGERAIVPTRPDRRDRGLAPVLAVLAAAGLGISSYLAAYQLGLLASVWDPLFGHGSERVLTSGISRALPVPDASLGTAAYAIDLVLALATVLKVGRGGLVVRALAVVASFGALVAIGLVVLQPIVAGTFCSLCLASAAVSVALAIGAVTEARAASHLRSHQQSEAPR